MKQQFLLGPAVQTISGQWFGELPFHLFIVIVGHVDREANLHDRRSLEVLHTVTPSTLH